MISRELVAEVMFRHGWSTKCRNTDVCVQIQRRADSRARILDVGCGARGLASFLPDRDFAGIDVITPDHVPRNMSYTTGTITAIPYGDSTFDTVASVDTLEHLAPELRKQGISELVRVASHTIVLACPTGENARACDERLYSSLRERGKPIPDWLLEHRANPYPTSAEIRSHLAEAARSHGKTMSVEEVPSELIHATRVVRAAGARSSFLFAGVSLLLGQAYRVLPRPPAHHAYRTIFVVSLTPRHTPPAV